MNRETRRKSKKRLATEEELIVDKGRAVLNTIISETYARHNDLTEKEYVKLLSGKNRRISEDKLVKVGMYNIFVEQAKVLMAIQESIKLAEAILKDQIGVK